MYSLITTFKTYFWGDGKDGADDAAAEVSRPNAPNTVPSDEGFSGALSNVATRDPNLPHVPLTPSDASSRVVLPDVARRDTRTAVEDFGYERDHRVGSTRESEDAAEDVAGDAGTTDESGKERSPTSPTRPTYPSRCSGCGDCVHCARHGNPCIHCAYHCHRGLEGPGYVRGRLNSGYASRPVVRDGGKRKMSKEDVEIEENMSRWMRFHGDETDAPTHPGCEVCEACRDCKRAVAMCDDCQKHCFKYVRPSSYMTFDKRDFQDCRVVDV